LHVFRGHDDAVTAVAFDRDGGRLATGSTDQRILVWNLESPHPDESPRELLGHEQSITDLAFAEDRDVLVSASNDATVRLWQLAAGEVVTLRGHDQPVQELLFTHDGTLVSVSYDGSARLWPMHAGALATRICEAIGTTVPPAVRDDVFAGSPPEPFCVARRVNTE